jgi:hypothetical protein
MIRILCNGYLFIHAVIIEIETLDADFFKPPPPLLVPPVFIDDAIELTGERLGAEIPTPARRDGFVPTRDDEEEVAEADEIAFDIDSDEAGCIYAYSFPTLKKENGRFPVKIGLTTSGDPENRVNSQCRQTCCFEHPTILGSWRVDRVAAFESAIHSTLEARGLRREAPGAEWFDTTLE